MPMLRSVILDGGDLQSWAKLQTETTGQRHCSKCTMGRLLAALDPLVICLDLPNAPRKP